MNKHLLTLFFLLLGICCSIFPKAVETDLLSEKINAVINKSKRKATIPFVFKNEELVDIINMFAAKKDINVILPTGANAINVKLSLALPNKVTLQEAWDLLITILDIAGYSLAPTKKDLYVITKNSKLIVHEPFNLYINSPLNELPASDERIRYIYYLKNIKAAQEFNNQINGLFKEIMPEDALLKAEPNTNSLLIIGKSTDIKAFMEIVQTLDEIGFQEQLETIRLRYTQAGNIAKIFADILKTAAPQQPMRYNLDNKKEQATYFSSNVKVIPEPRTNSLIVLGRAQAVARVKDFIFKHIDTELDSGKSILHVYELQYLDATEFAPVLRNIVSSARSGGTEQSKSAEAQSGTERFFEQVVIQVDSSSEPTTGTDESTEGKYSGGNKLIIAARSNDWKRIKGLIEQLDQPQPQVIIEVLIADITLDDLRNIGGLTRNINDLVFPGSATAQSAMLDQVVLDAPSSQPAEINKLTGVDSDINAMTVTVPNSDPVTFTSVPNNLRVGTTVISISDKNGRTWGLLEILKMFNSTKILSHPHIIAINNQKATIKIGEDRLVTDQAAPSTSGITIRKETLSANTNVYITPRISSANTVNLQIVIDIDQFTDPTNLTSGDRIARDVVTNATVKTGDILALGGLISETTADALLKTPLISDIPILGWFFKQKAREAQTTSLTVFISPTIIQPKLRGGIGEYTKSYVEAAKNATRQTGLFDSLRDPITRWFFKSESEAALITSDFLDKDQVSEELHVAKAVDLIAEREAEILDEHLGIAPLTTASALKEFLVNEENPLKQNNVPIQGAPRIKENAMPETKPHIHNNAPLHSPEKPASASPSAEQTGPQDLKALLLEEDNPLLNASI